MTDTRACNYSQSATAQASAAEQAPAIHPCSPLAQNNQHSGNTRPPAAHFKRTTEAQRKPLLHQTYAHHALVPVACRPPTHGRLAPSSTPACHASSAYSTTTGGTTSSPRNGNLQQHSHAKKKLRTAEHRLLEVTTPLRRGGCDLSSDAKNHCHAAPIGCGLEATPVAPAGRCAASRGGHARRS